MSMINMKINTSDVFFYFKVATHLNTSYTSTLGTHNRGLTIHSKIFKSANTLIPSSSIASRRWAPLIYFIFFAIISITVHEIRIATFWEIAINNSTWNLDIISLKSSFIRILFEFKIIIIPSFDVVVIDVVVVVVVVVVIVINVLVEVVSGVESEICVRDELRMKEVV